MGQKMGKEKGEREKKRGWLLGTLMGIYKVWGGEMGTGSSTRGGFRVLGTRNE